MGAIGQRRDSKVEIVDGVPISSATRPYGTDLSARSCTSVCAFFFAAAPTRAANAAASTASSPQK